MGVARILPVVADRRWRNEQDRRRADFLRPVTRFHSVAFPEIESDPLLSSTAMLSQFRLVDARRDTRSARCTPTNLVPATVPHRPICRQDPPEFWPPLGAVLPKSGRKWQILRRATAPRNSQPGWMLSRATCQQLPTSCAKLEVTDMVDAHVTHVKQRDCRAQ